jgi:hypothetical protein
MMYYTSKQRAFITCSTTINRHERVVVLVTATCYGRLKGAEVLAMKSLNRSANRPKNALKPSLNDLHATAGALAAGRQSDVQ